LSLVINELGALQLWQMSLPSFSTPRTVGSDRHLSTEIHLGAVHVQFEGLGLVWLYQCEQVLWLVQYGVGTDDVVNVRAETRQSRWTTGVNILEAKIESSPVCYISCIINEPYAKKKYIQWPKLYL